MIRKGIGSVTEDREAPIDSIRAAAATTIRPLIPPITTLRSTETGRLPGPPGWKSDWAKVPYRTILHSSNYVGGYAQCMKKMPSVSV